MATGRTPVEGPSVEQLMSAVLGMLVAEREDRFASALDTKSRPEPRKTEVILSNAGLSHQQIADLVGKKSAAVSKTISRAKAKPGADA